MNTRTKAALIVLLLGFCFVVAENVFDSHPDPIPAPVPVPQTVYRPKPRDCDWDYAPLGDKGCHYKDYYVHENGVYDQFWRRVQD